jgi:hypothetical protein
VFEGVRVVMYLFLRSSVWAYVSVICKMCVQNCMVVLLLKRNSVVIRYECMCVTYVSPQIYVSLCVFMYSCVCNISMRSYMTISLFVQ